MNKTKNTRVSKAQALGLVTYLMYNTDYHFDFDVSEDRCEVTIFVHRGAELLSLEIELRPFIVDGCTTKSTGFTDGETWSYNIEYPCVWSCIK